MPLDFLLKLLAWTMFVGPIAAFIVLSGYMVWGAANDDDVIMGLVITGGTVTAIGGALLILIYLMDISFSTLLGA